MNCFSKIVQWKFFSEESVLAQSIGTEHQALLEDSLEIHQKSSGQPCHGPWPPGQGWGRVHVVISASTFFCSVGLLLHQVFPWHRDFVEPYPTLS